MQQTIQNLLKRIEALEAVVFRKQASQSFLMEDWLNGLNVDELIIALEAKGFDRETILEQFQEFTAYWTETNTRGKQRWQGEKYFDVKRRLTTWFRNVRQRYQYSIPSF